MKFTILAGALLLSGFATALPNSSENVLSPLYTTDNAETVTDSYIVVLKDSCHHPTKLAEHTSWVNALANENNSPWTQWLHPVTSSPGVRHVYNMPTIKGYSGKFDPTTLHAIRSSEDVAYVEKDSVVYANELQRGAPWGIARVSHRKELTLKTFNKYGHSPEGGNGVKVYVIDTGINVKHADFEGRAIWGKTVPEGDEDKDGNGHGSHCAGTIAGKTYGIAKKAKPVAVKVLRSNGSGSMSDVLLGVEWAATSHTKDAEEAQQSGKPYKGAVANMSLGGGKSRSLDTAVDGAVDSGVIFAVAAGNDNNDACKYSPANAKNAITVGATTLFDDRASFSNYGKCVDVFAPGQDILSIWNTNDHATNTISGTSMASPHVAGLAAYLLSLEEGTDITPKQIKDKIIKLSTRDILNDIPSDTPNLLIYNGAKCD